MKVKSESEVTQSCLALTDPMDCSLQAPPSMGLSRQEYWSGVPLLSQTKILVLINMTDQCIFVNKLNLWLNVTQKV